jgi:hypothetical protein
MSMIADRDPFAYAGRQENQDSEILALFYKWLDVCAARDALADDDETAIADNDRSMIAIERAIVATRGGVVGLAVKAFLDCRLEAGRWTPKTAQLRFWKDSDSDSDLYASLLRDAAMIVPEIGECAAAIIHDDAELIDAEMDLQWVAAVWPGDPQSTDEWRSHVLSEQRNALACIANTPAKTPRGEAIKAKHASATGPA